MQQFANDDEFREWCQSYPEGFVINTNRPKINPRYFVLHLALCRSLRLKNQSDGAYTGGQYQKFAALRVDDFRQLMRREGISDFSKLCSLCSPRPRSK